jgi:TonB family protein
VSASATLLPPSVAALNQLLGERRAPDLRLRVALGVSYGVHVAFLAAVLFWFGARSYQEFGDTPVSTGILPVTPLYSPGAPPGPRPAVVAAPRPVIEEKKPAEPAREKARAPEVKPPDDADLLREAKPARPSKPTPKPAAAPATAPKAIKPEPGATGQPGGGTLPSARGAAGSPTGTLSGDPDGGLTQLLFTDQWYAARIRDIVYSNWGDPFYGQARPSGDLVVLVRFVIDRRGGIALAEVERPSGNPAWDRSGLRAVENSKLPPLPPDYPGARLVVHYEFRTEPGR